MAHFREGPWERAEKRLGVQAIGYEAPNSDVAGKRDILWVGGVFYGYTIFNV